MYYQYMQFEYFCNNVGNAITVQIVSNLGALVGYSLLIYLIYFLFWKPYELYQDVSAYGFEEVNASGNFDRISKRNVVNRLQKQRKTGDLPPPYPNGWYALLESREIPTNRVKEINVLGLNLVGWRGDSGRVYVSDAYCPHLGAHLGVRGKSSKECITCPFHGWTFDGSDGRLVSMPHPYTSHSKTTEELAKLKMRRIEEKNGFVFMWYHSEGKDPTWFPESVPQVESGRWAYRGKSEFRVACHIQEIQENAADLNHLDPVHGAIAESGPVDKLLSWFGIKYCFSMDSEWKPFEEPENRHKSRLHLGINQVLFNSKVTLRINEQSTLYGPGIVVLDFETPMGKAVIFTTMTPLEPQLVKFTHILYSSRTVIHPIAKLILHLETNMIARDVRIWNRKYFVKNPVLPKEDACLKKYRLWFKQFYSENNGSQNHCSKGNNLQNTLNI